MHEGNEADRNKDKCSGGAAAMSFCETTGTALSSAAFSSAAFSSAFARTRLASLFPATSSAFFTTALVRLIHGRPCSAFRFFAADTTFLVTSLDLRCLPFLLRCVFLFASSCHELPPSQVSDITTHFVYGLDLLLFSEVDTRVLALLGDRTFV